MKANVAPLLPTESLCLPAQGGTRNTCSLARREQLLHIGTFAIGRGAVIGLFLDSASVASVIHGGRSVAAMTGVALMVLCTDAALRESSVPRRSRCRTWPANADCDFVSLNTDAQKVGVASSTPTPNCFGSVGVSRELARALSLPRFRSVHHSDDERERNAFPASHEPITAGNCATYLPTPAGRRIASVRTRGFHDHSPDN